MDVVSLSLPGLKLLRPRVFVDERGFFLEPWNAARFRAAGLDVDFVQDNHSRSVRGTIRGMHLQRARGGVPGQAKLVRCARGAIVDVVVDVRPWSPTFKKAELIPLDDTTHEAVFIPVGFAHGFCVVSDVADVCYKVSSPYDPSTETGFRYDDPALGIAWPVAPHEIKVSARDAGAPTLDELLKVLWS